MRLLPILALTCLGPAPRADLWVVDSSGAGDFTDLQAAVDAAQPDDSIVVLSGAYSSVVIEKPIRIIGSGPGDVSVGQLSDCYINPWYSYPLNCPPTNPSTGLTVRGLPSGATVFVSGMTVRGHSGQFEAGPKALIEDNQGIVHLHDLRAAFEDEYETQTLVVRNSTLTLISSSEFRGAVGTNIGDVFTTYGFSPAAEGGLFVDSTVWVMNSTFEGGGGGLDRRLLPSLRTTRPAR